MLFINQLFEHYRLASVTAEKILLCSIRSYGIRDIEILARGYFQGGEILHQQIQQGNIPWCLNQLKECERTKQDYCSELEQGVLSFSGIFGNKPAWVAIAIVMVLQSLWTFLPWMQVWFGTDSISLWSGFLILFGGLLILLVVEMEKAVSRTWRRGH